MRIVTCPGISGCATPHLLSPITLGLLSQDQGSGIPPGCLCYPDCDYTVSEHVGDGIPIAACPEGQKRTVRADHAQDNVANDRNRYTMPDVKDMHRERRRQLTM